MDARVQPASNRYGAKHRGILRAKKLNFEVLDVRPDFPQTLAELDFSAFHVVRSILSYFRLFQSVLSQFYHIDSVSVIDLG